MASDWLVTFAPVIGLLADVITQIGCAKAFRRITLSIVAGVLCGLAATATCTVLGPTSPHRFASAATAILTYLPLACGYWTFLNLNITSLRVRMLREILDHGGAISRSELLASYTDEEFLRRRLERLERAAQLCCVDGRWRLQSPTLLFLARFLEFLRIILLPPQASPDGV